MRAPSRSAGDRRSASSCGRLQGPRERGSGQGKVDRRQRRGHRLGHTTALVVKRCARVKAANGSLTITLHAPDMPAQSSTATGGDNGGALHRAKDKVDPFAAAADSSRRDPTDDRAKRGRSAFALTGSARQFASILERAGFVPTGDRILTTYSKSYTSKSTERLGRAQRSGAPVSGGRHWIHSIPRRSFARREQRATRASACGGDSVFGVAHRVAA